MPRRPQRLVRQPVAAERYGVSVRTIRRRISDGTIHGYRAGPRVILVDLDEIEAKLLRPIPAAKA